MEQPHHSRWRPWLYYAIRVVITAVIIIAISKLTEAAAKKYHLDSYFKDLQQVQAQAISDLHQWTPEELANRYTAALLGNRPISAQETLPVPGETKDIPIGFPSDPLAGNEFAGFLFRPIWSLYIVLYDLFATSAVSCLVSTLQAAAGAGTTVMLRLKLGPRPGPYFWLWALPVGAVVFGSLIGAVMEGLVLLALCAFHGIAGLVTQVGALALFCKEVGHVCAELIYHGGVERQIEKIV